MLVYCNGGWFFCAEGGVKFGLRRLFLIVSVTAAALSVIRLIPGGLSAML
jgi:hypothetical protein